jgi:polyphosphate glucokinase
MKARRKRPAAASRDSPRTLAIDVGGTALKASVLDRAGRMLARRVRVATPHPCLPETFLRMIAELTAPLRPFDRISIGFPGVIRAGHVLTAPHLGDGPWRDFPLEEVVSRRFGKPTRVLNDAEVQGLGIIRGRGLEVVLTLGTGIGSAIFSDGRPAPHLELAHHPIRNDKTYDDYIGNEARIEVGVKKWNRRIRKVIEVVYSLLYYDVLYLGGGNSAHLERKLPRNVRVSSNDTGITGGIRLWDEKVWQAIPEVRLAAHPGSSRARGSGPIRAPRERPSPLAVRIGSSS